MAVPILIAAGVAAAASIASALIAKAQQDGLTASEEEQLKQALAQFDGMTPPELERLQAEQLGPSAMAGVKVDPRYREAQMNALRSLQEMGQGGLSMEDRASLEESGLDASRSAEAARQRIAQGMAGRGQLGSGAQLALSMRAASDSAQAAHQRGRDAHAQAQQRGLQALIQGGQMAGAMRGQEWGEESSRARAADEIARWNAQARDSAKRYNAGLGQQHFQNRMAIASAKANPRGQMANYYQREGQRQADFTNSIGADIGDAARGVSNAYQNDQHWKDWLKTQGGG